MRYGLKSLFLATAFVATWLWGYLYGIGFRFAQLNITVESYWLADEEMTLKWWKEEWHRYDAEQAKERE